MLVISDLKFIAEPLIENLERLMNLYRLLFTALLCQVFFASNCFAQIAEPPFNFHFQDAFIPVQETGCIEVRVENFTDIISFEFALKYDDTNFGFQNIESAIVSENSLDAVQSIMTDEPVVTVIFLNFSDGISVPDNTILFSLCFQAKGEDGESALIEILDTLPNRNPSQLFTSTDAYVVPDFNLIPGAITIGESTSTNVSPTALHDLITYPNPVVDKLYLDTANQSWNYKIINLQGQKMMEGQYQNYVDVHQLPSGIYFLQLQQESELYKAVKFVKE